MTGPAAVRPPRRRWPRIAAGLSILALLVLFCLWRSASDQGGQKPAEPFRIAGNLYYVGASDVAAFLLTGPRGHVLIDGGYPGTPPLIMDSIAKLGFKITDVKLILNSHAHFDHAGGLAALKEASGAQLWVSEGDSDAVESGGARDSTLGPIRFLAAAGILSYPAAKVDRRFGDGTVVRLGDINLTAHVTPGHTKGCTSWAIPVRDRGRDLLAVEICGLGVPPFESLAEPAARGDFQRSFRVLRSLPADIYLAPHAREFGRWRKFHARSKGGDPAGPFIDRQGYRSAIDRAEDEFRDRLKEQQRRQSVEQ
ncbi:MAG TPA: subclass B3 metallo-beta-lactamase [Allosphingosinicella sp.]